MEESNVQPSNFSKGLRFRRVVLEKIYFKEYLCDEFKNSRYPIPDNIRNSRNRAI
jgi:hypothetical protein